ncbi:MAG: hypothetical protein ACRDYA_06160 [Egibacteraceae bacterium]
MWQDVLIFMFGAGLAWLSAQSAALPLRVRRIDDEECARWLTEFRRDWRR